MAVCRFKLGFSIALIVDVLDDRLTSNHSFAMYENYGILAGGGTQNAVGFLGLYVSIDPVHTA